MRVAVDRRPLGRHVDRVRTPQPAFYPDRNCHIFIRLKRCVPSRSVGDSSRYDDNF